MVKKKTKMTKSSKCSKVRLKKKSRLLKNKIISSIVAPIIVSVILFLLTPLGEMVNTAVKSISVENITTRNTPIVLNENEKLNVNNQEDYFKNLVEHSIIFSGSKDVIIDEIELKNVKVTPYEYEDFKGVPNFNEKLQEFQAFIYQNGSANNVVPRFRIDLIKPFGKDEKRLTSHIVENINYDSGDIKSFNYSLIENDIKKYFKNSDEIALQVSVFLDDTNERLITEYLIYNKDKKIFEKAPLGGAGSGPKYEPINLFI